MTLFETNQNNRDNCRGDINNVTPIGINVSFHTFILVKMIMDSITEFQYLTLFFLKEDFFYWLLDLEDFLFLFFFTIWIFLMREKLNSHCISLVNLSWWEQIQSHRIQ